jgi:hypothetical protein
MGLGWLSPDLGRPSPGLGRLSPGLGEAVTGPGRGHHRAWVGCHWPPHYVEGLLESLLGGLVEGLVTANLWTKAPTYVRIGPLMRRKPVWHHSHGLILIGAG